MATIEELEAQLRAAKAAAAADEAAKRESVPVVWRFTVEPVTDSHREVYDDTVRLYKIVGEVVNTDEAREAGHHGFALSGGAMVYYYNTVTQCIIGTTGGGTIFIGRGFGRRESNDYIDAMSSVSAFIASNPEGGDITEIVMEHRRKLGFA